MTLLTGLETKINVNFGHSRTLDELLDTNSYQNKLNINFYSQQYQKTYSLNSV